MVDDGTVIEVVVGGRTMVVGEGRPVVEGAAVAADCTGDDVDEAAG